MGTHRDTGERLEGLEDVEQSVGEILRTPLRSRVMRPDFGADLLGAVDLPMNAEGRAKAVARTAGAVARWEPRIRTSRVTLEVNGDGETDITLIGTVDGEVARASSSVGSVTDARRTLSPSLYYDPSTYDEAAGIWRALVGQRALEAVSDPDVSGTSNPPGVAANGVYFGTLSEHQVLWSGAPSSGDALRLDRAWTVGVAYPVGTYDRDDNVWSISVQAAPGSPFESWITHFGPSGGAPPFLVRWLPSTVNVDQAPASGGLYVCWLWYRPPSPGVLARLGHVATDGSPAEVDVPDPGAVSASLVIGGQVDATATAGANRAIYGVGVWPRVLRRRERLGLESMWRREMTP